MKIKLRLCQTSINSILGSLAKHNKAAVKNLGVLFDSEFKFDKQINLVAKSCFFNLRLLAKWEVFFSDLKPLFSHV